MGELELEDGGELSDEALLSGMAVGDERCSLVFVRRHQRRLFGLARAIVGDPLLAEDVAQEAFLRVVRHAGLYDARRGSVSAWTLTITRNLAIDALRIRHAIPTDPDDVVFMKLMSVERHPEDAAEGVDGMMAVREGLGEMPDDQRRAVLLAAVYGWTAAEIAQKESIPLGTAKSRIRLGMARLRDSISTEETS